MLHVPRWMKARLRRLTPIALALVLVLGVPVTAIVATSAPAFAADCGTVGPPATGVLLSGSDWLSGNGVNIYSNGTHAPPSGDGLNCGGESYVNNSSGVSEDAGGEWQCVELVNRLYLARGWIQSHWFGNGSTLKDNLPSGLTAQANGAITSIVPGDVVTLNYSTYGHAGVVSAVTPITGTANYTVSIVNQNQSSTAYAGTATWDPTAKTLTSEYSGGFTTQDVIHAAGNTGSGSGGGGSGGGGGSTSNVQMIRDGSGDVWAQSAGTQSMGWTQETFSGVAAIASGGGIQMILDSAGQVWAQSGDTLTSGWTQESPAGEKAIAVTSSGVQMILDGSGEVWAMSGIHYMGSWTPETPTGEKAISGGGVQMILDSAGDVWAQSAGTLSSSWTQESPAGEKAISSGSNFQMILDSAGDVWAQSGTTLSSGWTQETGAGEVAISAGSVQMLLDSTGEVWGMSSLHYMGGWTPETGAGAGETAISAGSSVQMLRDSTGQVWAQSTSTLSTSWTRETPAGELTIAAG